MSDTTSKRLHHIDNLSAFRQFRRKAETPNSKLDPLLVWQVRTEENLQLNILQAHSG